MKKYILIFLFLFPILSFSQGFYIKNYNVKMKVQKSGKVQVTERILVNFTERKRGIIRAIPTLYYISKHITGEKSTRAEPSENNRIQISNLKVNRKFTDQSTDAFKTIRIGSADKFLTGLQWYVISYTVEGIVNTFENHDELNWNVIGNQWDVPIEKITFRVDFEGASALKRKDVLIYTGKSGSKESDAQFTLSGALRGSASRKFEANEALTLALRFNKNYFKPFWKITDIETLVGIRTRAACVFTENLVVKYSIYGNGFTYKIPRFRMNEKGEKEELFLKYPRASKGKKRKHFKLKIEPENYVFHIGGEIYENYMLLGYDTLQVDYELWGAVYYKDNETFFDWNFFENRTKKTSVNQKIRISLPKQTAFAGNEIQNANLRDKSRFQFNEYLRFEKKYSRNSVDLKLKIPEGLVPSILPLEYIKNADFYAISTLNAEIEITQEKEVRIKEEVKIAILNEFTQNFKHPLEFSSEDSYYSSYYPAIEYSKIRVNRKAVFDKNYKPLIYNITINNGYFSDWGSEFLWPYDYSEKFNRFPVYHFAYDLYDVICKTDSGALVSIPLYLGNESIYNGKCTVLLPEKVNKQNVKCFLHDKKTTKEVEFEILDNKCIINLESFPLASENLTVTVLFPEEFVSSSILSKEVELFYANNKTLFIPPFVFLLLFIIWYFFGKDKKHTLVVRYEPPQNITPAEAGLLWDDKLHNRDMISLIYYWASKGFLEVIQDSSKKITLKKLAELPEKSKQFEKTIFNALFDSKKIGSEVALSSLKTPFTKAFKKAFKEMKKYSKKEGFYSGFSNFLSRLFVFVSYTLIVLAIVVAVVERNTDEIVMSLFLTAVVLYVFGRIMIKKTLHASKIYSEILGFKEFIVTAELGRLRELSAENPKYFEETIAYAIILGYAKVWAEKFAGLLTEPPSWYKGHDTSNSFDTSVFTRNLVADMYRMENSFNYKPPKPKRTYSSSSYSSSSSSSSSSWSSSSWSKSSSSSSSSSYSGSSSFSSGGGSAGGGYGGGGGSSW